MTNTGYKQACFFGKESTYGSAATINRSFGIVQSVTPTETNNTIKVRTMNGGRDYFTVVPGKYECSGGVEYMLQDCRFLKYAVGEDSATTSTTDSGPRFIHSTVSGGVGTTYWHIMGSAESPDANNFPSFSMELADDEDAVANRLKRTFSGCMVDSLTISGDVDSPVTVAMDFIAQNVYASTSVKSAVTEGTEDPFVFYQGGMYLTSADINGTNKVGTTDQLCELNNFSFTINNNLEPTWYISGTTSTQQSLRSLKSLIPKGRDYEASIGLNFKNWDQYRRFLGSATNTGIVSDDGDPGKFQLVLDFIRAGEGFGYGATTASSCDMFRIVMASCIFDDVSINGSPEDIVAEDYTVFPKSVKIHTFDDISGTYE